MKLTPINTSLMNYFISPLINTVTFIYEWVLASIIRSTMVGTSPPRKGKNGDDSDCGSTSSSQSQQQRKMFGEHNENVNNTPSSSCTDSKMNCKKRIGTTNQQNDKSDSSPSESKRSPMAVSASKSVSLGPRLRSRQNLLPVCEEESLPNVEEKSTISANNYFHPHHLHHVIKTPHQVHLAQRNHPQQRGKITSCHLPLNLHVISMPAQPTTIIQIRNLQ